MIYLLKIYVYFFRTVKFWDLETFQLVSSTDPETGGVR